MGKRSSSPQSKAYQIATKTPDPPQPTNEYIYEDGVMKGSRTYDPGSRSYYNQTFRSQAEKDLYNAAQSGALSALQGGNAIDLSPEAIARYRDAYAAPQRDALTRSYNEAKGAATSSANASGLQDSVGFNKYLAGELERNKAQGLADIENNATMMEYQLPSLLMQPWVDKYNFNNAALTSDEAASRADLAGILQGTGISNDFTQNGYNQLLAKNQFRAQYAPVPQQRSGGFLSRLFGG